MEQIRISCAGTTAACRWARDCLEYLGVRICRTGEESPDYLLLDVPSFQANGALRGGGDIRRLLEKLPREITVCGGNLNHPALAEVKTIDFLLDEEYLCRNARITAECALDVAMPLMGRMFYRCPILILGWGRIGKCLAQLLKAMEADVTVAVRNPGQKAMLRALGFRGVLIQKLEEELPHFRMIFNTVPSPVLSREALEHCRSDCVKIELASRDGMEGEDIIVARGLPGIHMPESSGRLIAETFLRLAKRR